LKTKATNNKRLPLAAIRETNSLLLRTLIFSCLFISGLLTASGQSPERSGAYSNLRSKLISTRSTTVQIDSFSIQPKTFRIEGISDTTYVLDLVNAQLTWKSPPEKDSVPVSYRVFPQRLNARYQRMVYDSVMNNFMGQPSRPVFATEEDDRFFDFGNITYNGSFGRGISFGNSQDAVVSSNLNLQLSGYLADSIEIAAAITDNNIPIQPDGTTQQLNEFDRIFLQFRKRNWQLSLGDIDIRQSQSYFLNFYKRLQGIAFETTSQISSKISNKTLVSGSIAKGKFTRNVFQGQEGNQGPYRLTGANNEFFFVVLANTERVYLDGELLQRGEDQDYVINYNTAEIAFTPKRMITKDRRIQVEFEYSDRNYLNANLYGYNETNISDKLKIRVSAFSNNDAKNSPINQTLDGPQKEFLNSIGNRTDRAFYPIATIDTFSAGKILYKQIDTLIDGNTVPDTIYVFSTNPDSARYSLSFIDVGEGNGNYTPDFNGANGKVFRWIAPVNGVSQGRFEPAVFLVAPKKQQVLSVGADYQVTKTTSINTEVAMSNFDPNTFSSKDEGNNKGMAARLLVKNEMPVGSPKKGRLFTTEAGVEYVQAKFRPLERIRNVEYTRDWGLPIQNIPEDELILTGAVQLSRPSSESIRYQFTNYKRGDNYNGVRNALIHTLNRGGWKANNNVSLTNFNLLNDKGFFFRPILNFGRVFKKLGGYGVDVSYSLEHNEIRNKISDTLTPQSFSFDIFQVSVKSDEAKLNKWGISYFTRSDAYPEQSKLLRSDRSHNVSVFTELLKNEKHQFRVTATYRNLTVINNRNNSLRPDNTLLSRVEYQVNELKGFVNGNMLYEVGSGQEQKRDFAFLEVPAGQGEYTWIDYDNNGIQSLNEFEVALFQDQAKYIRIFTPTNEFIKASYNTFNYSVTLDPRYLIDVGTAKGMRKLISNISFQSSMQLNKKEQSRGIVQFNPFSSPLSDTSLITLNSIFINTFSFNRMSSKWGLDLSNARNESKALLTYGYETRKLDDWSARVRYSFVKWLAADITVKQGVNQLRTSNAKFGNRNFDIDLVSIEPRITFTRGADFRLITGYRFSDKRNKEGSLETAVSHALNTEIKYNILQSTSIQGKFSYQNIEFTSLETVPNANSTSAYILLDGLLPGKNFLWNLDLTKRLSKNLEMNVQYEGRKPGTSRIVHIGRAGVRALL
jgi:hypothetical protein